MTSEAVTIPPSGSAFHDTLAAIIASGAQEWTALGILFANWPDQVIEHGLQLLNRKSPVLAGQYLALVAGGDASAAHALLFRYIEQDQSGELRIVGDWLSYLPSPLRISGYLILDGCSGLKALPSQMSVGGTLFLFDCISLQGIPDDLVVGKHLLMTRCSGITSLPEGLEVNGALELSFSVSLTHLPTDLKVDGDLFLRGCASLQALPLALFVHGDLDIQDCKLWDGQIPPCAEIGGLIRTDEHPKGLALAEWRCVHG